MSGAAGCALRGALVAVAWVAGLAAAAAQDRAGDEAMAKAFNAFATELRVAAACHLGSTPVFGIWPLDGATLPVSEDSARGIYSGILAELSRRKPGCATFMDAAGASAVLRHLIAHGAYHVPGEDPRGEMDAGFRAADYFILLDLHDAGQTIRADLKLTTRDGALLAGMPPFPVLDAGADRSCGTGAVPLQAAIADGAAQLIDGAPGLRVLVESGEAGDAPGFGGFARRMLVDAIVQQSLDHVNLKRVAVVPEAAVAEEVFRLDLRHWACTGGERLVLSARLQNGFGTTASWNAAVLAASVPEGVLAGPPPGPGAPPEPAAIWSLSVTPREVHETGTIAVVAEVAEDCDPAFLILSPSGDAVGLPDEVFVVSPRPDGGREFRSDSSTP